MDSRRSRTSPSSRGPSMGLDRKDHRVRPWTFAIILVAVLVLTASLVSILVIGPFRSAGVEVERISVEIERDVCNVSVDLDVRIPAGRLGRSVEIVHGNGSEVLSLERERAIGSVSEEAFRSMINDGHVDVRGKVEAKVLGLIKMEREVSSKFDISSIASSLRNLSVSNITLTPTLKGYMVLKMDLGAIMDDRLDIGIINTEATLELITGTYKVTVDELQMTGSTGLGKCTLNVPTAAIFSLAFMDRTVSFDCFGISGSFTLP